MSDLQSSLYERYMNHGGTPGCGTEPMKTKKIASPRFRGTISDTYDLGQRKSVSKIAKLTGGGRFTVPAGSIICVPVDNTEYEIKLSEDMIVRVDEIEINGEVIKSTKETDEEIPF